MSLTELKKSEASRVMGIDCSTLSLAFAILDKGEPVKWGEIDISGDDLHARLVDVRKKMEVLSEQFDVDAIAFEKAVTVKSAEVAIKLAMVFGAALSVLCEDGAVVTEVYPISWQSFIGNPNLTPKERLTLIKKYPDKSKSWYQNAGRTIRKERTKKWVKTTYGIEVESDNVSDAFGLAYYCQEHLTHG